MQNFQKRSHMIAIVVKVELIFRISQTYLTIIEPLALEITAELPHIFSACN